MGMAMELLKILAKFGEKDEALTQAHALCLLYSFEMRVNMFFLGSQGGLNTHKREREIQFDGCALVR